MNRHVVKLLLGLAARLFLLTGCGARPRPITSPPPTTTPVIPITREAAIRITKLQVCDFESADPRFSVQASLITLREAAGSNFVYTKPQSTLIWYLQISGIWVANGGPKPTEIPLGITPPPTTSLMIRNVCKAIVDANTGELLMGVPGGQIE